MKKTLTTKPAPAGLTSRTVPTISKLTQTFLKEKKDKEISNGESGYLEEVGFALNMLAINYLYQTFSLSDVAQLVAQWEVPIEETTEIYNDWIAMLQQQSRVSEMLSVYRYPTYSFK